MKANELIEKLPEYNYKQLKNIHGKILGDIRFESESIKNKYIPLLKIIMDEIRERAEFLSDEQFDYSSNKLDKEGTLEKEVNRTSPKRQYYDHEINNQTGFTETDLYNMGGLIEIKSPTGKIFLAYSDDQIMNHVHKVVNFLNLKREKHCNKELLRDWTKLGGEKAFEISITYANKDTSINYVKLKQDLVKKYKEEGIELYNKR